MTTKNIPLFEEQYGYLMDKSMLEIFNLYSFDHLFVLSKVGLWDVGRWDVFVITIIT